MDYKIYNNGVFGIFGNTISLENCYPAINGSPIRPINISVEKDVITYTLIDGEIEIRFTKDRDNIAIRPTLNNIKSIHDCSLIQDCKLEGAENVYHISFGMEDNSGWNNIAYDQTESYGLVAVYSDKENIIVNGTDFRKYTIKYAVKREIHMFDEMNSFSCGYNLEGKVENVENLPVIYFRSVKNLEEGLNLVGNTIASEMKARTVSEPAFHWCSWYYLYQNFSQEYLEEYIDGFNQVNEKDFKYIQIDAGYCTSHGDWLKTNYRFSAGLDKAAEKIIKAGFKAGIWIGPFMVGDQSDIYKNHRDWLLKDLEGQLITKIKSYTEPKTWGNVDSNYYVLDMTNPIAFEYMRNVFRKLRKYGFTLFKTDFMLWNMIDSSKVIRYDNTLTSVEIMRNTLKMIREEIGEESYLLGCIAPFMPFVGYADGLRISGDMGAQWEGDFGPTQMMRDICADNFMNGIFWQNDPDSMILRDFDTHFSDIETESLVILQALSGGVVTTSEPVHRISQKRVELLDFVKPMGIRKAAIPYLATDEKLIILQHKLEQGNLLFLMNPQEDWKNKLISFKELFSKEEFYVYKWSLSSNEVQSVKTDNLYISLQGHESALYFLTEEKMVRKPKNIWHWSVQ